MSKLLAAAQAGKDREVLKLLAGGADINEPDERGVTPLHGAAMSGWVDTIKLLLEHGAEIERGNVAETPLVGATRYLHCEAMKALIAAGANINARHSTNQGTALHIAAGTQAAEPLIVLLVAGADVNARNTIDNTPLHLAAFSGWVGGCRVLIEHGAELDAVNARGETPLDMARQCDKMEVVKALDDAGASHDNN